jgi:hypothetical protein
MHQYEDDQQSIVGIYVTYNRKEDAAKAIGSLDGTTKDDNVLRLAGWIFHFIHKLHCRSNLSFTEHPTGQPSTVHII